LTYCTTICEKIQVVPVKTTFIMYVCTDRCLSTLKHIKNSELSFYCDKSVQSLYVYLQDIPDKDDNIVEFLQKFNPNVSSEPNELPFPVHFEYKIANQFGSFPEIYKKCRNETIKPYTSKEA